MKENPEEYFKQKAKELEAKLAHETEERKLLDAVFNMQHKRLKRAEKAWQEAHNKPDVIPDLGELVEWLMEKAGIE